MLSVRRVPPRRVALPAALSSLETVVALALAHVAAGGEVPNPVWLAAFGLVTYGAGRVVLRRRAGIRLVLPVLLAGQVLGHAWLVALAPGMHGGHGTHAAHGVHVGHAADQGTGLLLGLTGPMLLAHLAAAAVTGVAWALRRRAVAVLLAWAEPGRLPAPTLRRSAVAGRAHTPTPRLTLAIAPTRGPPAGALPAAA